MNDGTILQQLNVAVTVLAIPVVSRVGRRPGRTTDGPRHGADRARRGRHLRHWFRATGGPLLLVLFGELFSTIRETGAMAHEHAKTLFVGAGTTRGVEVRSTGDSIEPRS